MREYLEGLARALSEQGEDDLARTVRFVISSDDAKVDAFLVSNELWGEAGSIADHSGSGNARASNALLQQTNATRIRPAARGTREHDL